MKQSQVVKVIAEQPVSLVMQALEQPGAASGYYAAKGAISGFMVLFNFMVLVLNIR